MGRNRRFRGGFTLVEILIALAVLGIVITPVIGMFTSTARSNLKSRKNTVALTVARDIMDRIKAGDIDSTNIGDEIDNYKSSYDVEIKVDVPEDAGSNALEKLKVFVTPFRGMNAETEGILVASYTTNVFVTSIDTSPPEDPGGPGGPGDDPDPPPPPGSDEGDYWDWLEGILAVIIIALGMDLWEGLALIGAFFVYTFVLADKTEMNLIEAIVESGYIAHYIYKTTGGFDLDLFRQEVLLRHGVVL